MQRRHLVVVESIDGSTVAEEQSYGDEVIFPAGIVQSRPTAEVMHRGFSTELEQGGEGGVFSGASGVVQRRAESGGVLDDEMAALKHDLVDGILDAVSRRGHADDGHTGIILTGEDTSRSSDEKMHKVSIAACGGVQERGLAARGKQSAAIEERGEEFSKAAINAEEGGEIMEGEILANKHDKIEGQRETGF